MRAMFWAGSVVVALAVAVGAGRLWAEGKADKPAKPATPRTRIALLNLTYVIKNYDKYRQFQEEIKTIIDPFEKRQAELRKQVEELSKRVEDTIILPARAEDSEEKVKELQREIEETKQKAKKTLGKMSDNKMRIIFLEVVQAAGRYAKTHDFDLVLHYNDAITQEDYFGAPNIARKLNMGPLMPLYAVDGMDISIDLAKILNASMRKD